MYHDVSLLNMDVTHDVVRYNPFFIATVEPKYCGYIPGLITRSPSCNLVTIVVKFNNPYVYT